jgi:predicted glycoside hydrolase/deacetylase ChbG (UPF0249 family)
MVRWPDATQAAALAAARPRLAVGLHFDAGEWVFADGEWTALYERVPLEDGEAIAREVEEQLETFVRLIGGPPTHLDSHQHVHRREPTRAILLELAHRLDIPLRGCTPGVRSCGAFYGQTWTGEPWLDGISVEAFVALLASLAPGTTELVCHPASAVDVGGMYRHQRTLELETLCAPRVRQAIVEHEIALTSFAHAAGAWRTTDSS